MTQSRVFRCRGVAMTQAGMLHLLYLFSQLQSFFLCDGVQSLLSISKLTTCSCLLCKWISELLIRVTILLGLPRWLSGKESICQCRRPDFDPWVKKIPWRREWQPTPVSLFGKSRGQRRLEGCSPWGCKRVGHDLVAKDFLLSILMPSQWKGRHQMPAWPTSRAASEVLPVLSAAASRQD